MCTYALILYFLLQEAVVALVSKTDRMKLQVQHDPLPSGFKVGNYYFQSIDPCNGDQSQMIEVNPLITCAQK